MTRPNLPTKSNTLLHKTFAVSAFSVLISPLLNGQAIADTMIDEIIVTAQKRSQSLQDVGISISAFNEDSIKKLGLKTVDGLAAAVPNLQALDAAAGLPSYRIRGQGLNEFQASFDSPVGVHVDEIFMSKPFMISMGPFDVERVEVLKGPQGTVFGRNTTGGAVNYYTNKPTEEFEAGVNASYGRYSRFEAEGFVSGPLSENLLGRLAVQVHNYDNDGPYTNLFNNEELGEKEQFQIRGQLKWSMGEDTNVLLSLHYGEKEADLTPYDNLFQTTPGDTIPPALNPGAVIDNPIGRYRINQDYYPTTDNERSGGLLRIDHEFEFGTFTSLTGYETFERDNREDSDATPVPSFNVDWYSDIKQFTQEFRLTGETESWNYLIGAYYEKDEVESVSTGDARAFIAPPLQGFYSAESDQETDTWAIFTSHEFAVSDELSVILGARYTEEKNDIDAVSLYGLPTAVLQGKANRIPLSGQAPSPVLPLSPPANDSRTDDDFNFKVGLNYKPNDDLLLYFSGSTGFRSGGYDFFFATPTSRPFDPEDVTAFELGYKQTLNEGRLQLNAAIFLTDVDDYQANVTFPGEPIPRRVNIGKLETQGFEADALWQPNEYWRVKLAAGYTDSEIAEVNTNPETGLPFVGPGNVTIDGNTPANAPELSLGAIVGYTQPINNDLDLEFLANYSWVDERYLEIENSDDHLVDSYNTLDLSVTLLSTDGKWSVTAWGRNVTDEDYLRYINDVPDFLFFLTINAEPATYGISAEYNF